MNLSRFRRGQNEIANHVIDEFVARRISRREFIRRGTVIGISIPVLDAILTACGPSATSTPVRPSTAGRVGATIKAGILAPTAAINPLTVVDLGGIDMMDQTGEYLTLSDQHLRLVPQLATKWSSNSAADVWTFSIRQGVKFHNGKPLTADDVVLHLQAQHRPEELWQCAVGVRRGSHPGWGTQSR